MNVQSDTTRTIRSPRYSKDVFIRCIMPDFSREMKFNFLYISDKRQGGLVPNCGGKIIIDQNQPIFYNYALFKFTIYFKISE